MNFFFLILFTVFHIYTFKFNRNPGVQLEFGKYERTFQMIRDKTIPKNPINCQEILESFKNEKIMESLGRSKHLGNSIFFYGVVQRERHSFCVFSSKYAISLIEKHIEPTRRHFMLDATFKVCPVDPFSQLLIIYTAYKMRMFFLFFDIGISIYFHINVTENTRSIHGRF